MPPAKPRTFFLNEAHELGSFERDGGGRQADYVPIDWSARAAALSASFQYATTPARSPDPNVDRHFFVVAVPVQTVQKRSNDKKVQGGIKHEVPTFGGEQSRLFRKLGMDLIETLPDGKATVHIPSKRKEQLLSTMTALPRASSKEKSRWINFEDFELLDWTSRVSPAWIETLEPHAVVEVAIRFQPTLTRLEINDVLQAITRILDNKQSRLTKAGREFSGRYWCLGNLSREIILMIARDFNSVQTIHPPIRNPVAAKQGRIAKQSAPVATSKLPALSVAELPTVAIVDCGIPEGHVYLAPFRRSGFRNPDIDPAYLYLGDHGSQVASCAVFGRLDMNGGITHPPPGKCRVIDVMVAKDQKHIDADLIVQAMETIVATAPDVRVFNLSFANPPLDTHDPVTRREHLMKLQDLDNFAFGRDVLLIVAAGNSPPGLAPMSSYPNHTDDPRWGLGYEARTFNGIVSGAYVDIVSDSVGGVIGAPSPFTRIGPGLCQSPVPGFSAPGGDSSHEYGMARGTGPWVCNAAGYWEDSGGTSLAAPIIAREVAWVLKYLARHCAPTSAPFGATVKAWLHLVAKRPTLTGAFEKLAERTLGKGFPTAERLETPLDQSAVFIWQTMLQAPKNVNRAQFPVPKEWLSTAAKPTLRVVCAWNTPVNIALVDSWACRKVAVKVRPFGGENPALRGGGNARIGAYPLIDRQHDISPKVLEQSYAITDSQWILEVEYDEIGEYPPAMTVSPQQRIGVVLELFDAGDTAMSPQAAIQALPVAMNMHRLGVLQQPMQTPILIRT